MENISRMATNMISSNWNFTGVGTATPQTHRGLKKELLSSSETSMHEIGRDSGVFLVASTRESTVESVQATDDETISKMNNTASDETLGEKVEEMKLQVTENEQTKPAEDLATQRAKKAQSVSYAGKRDSLLSCTSKEIESEFVLSDTEVLMRSPSAGGETFKVDTKPRKKAKKSDGMKKRFPRFGRRKSQEQPKKEEKVIRASTENTGAVGFIKYRDADGVVRFAQVSAGERQHGEEWGDTEDELEAEPNIPEEEEPTEEQPGDGKQEAEAADLITRPSEDRPRSADDTQMNETRETDKTVDVNETRADVNEAQTTVETGSRGAEVEKDKEREREETDDKINEEIGKESKNQSKEETNKATNEETNEATHEETSEANSEEREVEKSATDALEKPETESNLFASPVRKRTIKPADSWIRRRSAMSRNLDDHKPPTANTPEIKPAGFLVTQSPFMQKVPHAQGSPSKVAIQKNQLQQVNVPLTPTYMQGKKEGRTRSENRAGGGHTDKLIEEIVRLGKKNGYGQYEVEHGVLRKELGNDIGNFSATLLAAKRLQVS
jgi:hypothetical protein